MDKLTEVIAKLSEALTDVANQHGPAAGQLVLEAARISAIQNIIIGFACALIVGLLVGAIIIIERFTKAEKAKNPRYDAEGAGFAQLMSFFGSILFAVGAGIHLLHAASWVGMFRPEVYLAYQLLKKLGS